MKFLATKSVVPLAEYRILVVFENGERRVFDMNPYLEIGVFRELRDVAIFNSVRVAFDTVEWANGADLSPEVLYQRSQPALESA